MNLIEQLGGYEKAKSLTMSQVGLKKHYTDLQQALLQYRREHNIFEVGDFVTHPVFWGLFQIKKVMNHHIVGVTPTGYESKLAIQLIRHATPEEIKAGRRLEVCGG